MKSQELEPYRRSVSEVVSGVGLEIGFGTGLNLSYYNNVTKLYALDLASTPLAETQKRIKDATFPVVYMCASGEAIPLPDYSLDFVTSTWTLCSIPHPEAALREVVRVLRPGGVFSFAEHGKSPRSFVGGLQNCLTPVSKCLAGGCHLNRDMEALIEAAGFATVTVSTFPLPNKPLSYIYQGVAVTRREEV